MTAVMKLSPQQLQIELQSKGLKLANPQAGASGRQGGAGPSDHKAVHVYGATIMVPIFNHVSASSPYYATEPNEVGVSELHFEGRKITTISFPKQPNFYKYSTSDGIPMWKIAQLHSHNVLATTVLQTCIRYFDRSTSCQFCAIGQSLKAERTIAYKLPHHLAETAKIAVEQDGIEQFVMTTGTPSSTDRGAKILHQSVLAVRAVVDIPIQIQCEPPDDFIWFERLKSAGANSIGMHLETVEPHVRKHIMPGKAEVSVEYYMEAFKAAVKVFGRGNVSTYLLAGLGDSSEALIEVSEELIRIGVYPFIIPFVPIKGTPLENHTPPSQLFMQHILEPVAKMLVNANMTSDTLEAGCGKCGACSTLKSFETKAKLAYAV